MIKIEQLKSPEVLKLGLSFLIGMFLSYLIFGIGETNNKQLTEADKIGAELLALENNNKECLTYTEYAKIKEEDLINGVSNNNYSEAENTDGVFRDNTGAVIPTDGTENPENKLYLVNEPLFGHDEYLNHDALLYLKFKGIETLEDTPIEKGKKVVIFNDGGMIDLDEFKKIGYNIDGKNITKSEELKNRIINIGVKNEYREKNNYAINDYKRLLLLKDRGKIYSRGEDTISITNETDEFLDIVTEQNISNILIVDDINQKAYNSGLRIPKDINVRLSKQYIYEALYGKNIPENKQFHIYTYYTDSMKNIYVSNRYELD